MIKHLCRGQWTVTMETEIPNPVTNVSVLVPMSMKHDHVFGERPSQIQFTTIQRHTREESNKAHKKLGCMVAFNTIPIIIVLFNKTLLNALYALCIVIS